MFVVILMMMVLQIQFQLNRLPKCEMHSVVDSLSTLNIVFPDVKDVPPLAPPQEQ